MKTRLVVGATLLAVVGSSSAVAVAAQPAGSHTTRGATAAAASVSSWEAGIRAGTTKLSSATGASCKPRVGTTAADRRCKLTFWGNFKATDRPYHGTYYGTAFVTYQDPATTNYASFDSGSVTYKILAADGTLIRYLTLAIDTGTGGINGFPYDLSMSYAFEERNEEAGVVERLTGSGVNALDANLTPIRTFIDRLAFQSGI
jgi:hypothetical protein